MEAVGYISALCLIACGLPLATEAFRTGRSDVNPAFLTLWYTGEVLGLAYALWLGNGPMLANYGFNFAVLTIVVYYKVRPR